MARQWRIEYENGLYHVMSRGNEQREIVRDDHDREMYIDVLGRMCTRYEVQVYAYVLMDNHYHLLLRTPRGEGMGSHLQKSIKGKKQGLYRGCQAEVIKYLNI